MALNWSLAISTYCPICENVEHTSVKWWCRGRSRIARMRASPSALPIVQPSAKPESVGYTTSPPPCRIDTTWLSERGCGLSGCTSK